MEEQDQRLQRAKARVARMRNFYSGLIAYIVTNIILIIINLMTSPGDLWFYWVTIIWGIVLIVQAFNTFTVRDRFLGDEWEKKKIKELMDKEKKQ